mgnify:FL=1
MLKIISNKIILIQTILLFFTLIFTFSCTSNVVQEDINDPFENLNRTVFTFNENFDSYVLKPINDGYEKFPMTFKTSVSNHVEWASIPSTMLNSALQFEAKNFANSSIKFLLNSLTLGLHDLDKNTKFKNKDFGSTLAKYNISSGPYIVLPFLGPRSVRHFSGNIFDNSILNDTKNYSYSSSTLPLSVVSNRNKFSNVIEDIKNSQDPYLKTKILYSINRFNYLSSDKNIEKEIQNEQDEYEKLLD